MWDLEDGDEGNRRNFVEVWYRENKVEKGNEYS